MVRPRLDLLPRETHHHAHALRCLSGGARGGEGPQAGSCRPDGRIGGPQERFEQLESLLAALKQKKLAVSSYDLAAAEYFKLEVEYLLEKEKAR